MSNYKEIVTKTILGKGRKTFVTEHVIKPDHTPSTILGCWVINHNFSGNKKVNSVGIDGSYDVNIWYSYDDDKQTDVIKQTNNYSENVKIKRKDETSTSEDVIIRSLSDPKCSNVKIEGNEIKYTITKELGIELVGDAKVRINTFDEEDDWDDIISEEEVSSIDDVVEDNIRDVENLEEIKED